MSEPASSPVVIHDAAATTPHVTDPHDLRSFFRSVGRFVGERSLTTSPPERPEPDRPVEMLDDTKSQVTAVPLDVAGFVDGVQAAVTVTWREHRPVYLTYTAAGCVGERGALLASCERIDIVCSHLDVDWALGLGSSIPLSVLDESRPDLVERAALARLGADREVLERKLVTDLATSIQTHVVVDGSLVGRPVTDKLVGVVKTSRRRWLSDETVLWGLPAGWRSPRFKIPAGSQGVSADRYSCYLRLFDASNRSWDHALVRLESFDPELLDPLCALALDERQNPRAGDPRYDRHLASVRACEQVLRARRPAVFDL